MQSPDRLTHWGNKHFYRLTAIEWFEVAILDGFYTSLVQPQTKKHWHLYRKSARHEGGMKGMYHLYFY